MAVALALAVAAASGGERQGCVRGGTGVTDVVKVATLAAAAVGVTTSEVEAVAALVGTAMASWGQRWI